MVRADDPDTLEALAPVNHITQQQLLSAAGTYGDFTRYLQVLPGVAWNSDLSNEILVRGGHPLENLFVVDGIEIPNINHFSLSGSNGGFTSMIDSSTIGSVDFRAGVYDASYSSRLSSLIQVHTRQLGESDRATELTVGIAGAGGFYQTTLPHKASLLVSAHRSVINLVTKDVGINGSPVYSNELARLDWSPSERDSISVLSLSGNDNIKMNPCNADWAVTSSVETDYSGWRTTEGLGWNHFFAPHLNSRLTVATSITSQNIGQQYQIGTMLVNGFASCLPATVESVYTERSRDGLSSLNYQLQADTHGWLISAGGSGKLMTPDDAVSQPIGEPSPFSLNPAWSDSISMSRRFATGQTAAFIEADGNITSRWKVLAGLRTEAFSIVGRYTLDPRVSFAYRLSERHTIHASWEQSSQLPPTIDLLTYPGNRNLQPVQARQSSVGIRLLQTGWGTLDAEAYAKQYNHEAVSTEYPQLALSNMIDTLGQWFVWLPLVSSGTASSRGVELTLRAHAHNRFQMLASSTYSRSTYRPLDGVQRRGSYDFPVVANVMANVHLVKGVEWNARETYSSGRPYTPFDLSASLAQNRGIYDLTEVNGLRGPFYNRLDVELEKRFHLGKGLLDLHLGADNILDRRNFLGYVWLPNCESSPFCTSTQTPIERLPQMGLYPSFAARYQF